MEGLDRIARKAIENRIFPGCVVGVLNGDSYMVSAYGSCAYDENAVTNDTVYDCASVTKSVVTTTIAFQCVDEGLLSLDELVATHLPEFRNAQSHQTTVRHLLSYGVGGYALAPLVSMSADEITQYVLTKDFDAAPGERQRYANMPMFLLGLVLERVTKTPLMQLVSDRVFTPYRMSNSSMASTLAKHVAPTEVGVCGIVHDESARVFAREGRAVGHAGLFSTAHDLLVFSKSLLEHAPRTALFEQGLGWERNTFWMGDSHSPLSVGKTGFTGTSIVIDSEKQSALVVLSNRTYPHRESAPEALTQFRNEIHTTAFR